MPWSNSSRFGIASISYAVCAILTMSPVVLVAQSISQPSVIAVALRTGSAPPLSLQQPATLHVGGVLDNPDDELDHKNGFIAGAMLSNGRSAPPSTSTR